jgi:hypothetical protein
VGRKIFIYSLKVTYRTYFAFFSAIAA